MQSVHARGAYIKVLDRPGLDLTTPSGRGILALLSVSAEEERTRILRRANEGRIAAIKRGSKLGRRLTPAAGSYCSTPGRLELPGHRQDVPGAPRHDCQAGGVEAGVAGARDR
jgi:Resolvase, N terminal domain